MNGSWLTIVGAAMSVFAVIGIGAAVRRAGWLTEEADHSLFKLIIRVLLPCLIFTAVSRNPALKDPANLLLPPLVGFSTIVLGLAAGMLLVRLPDRWLGLTGRRQRRTFVFTVGVYNYGFLAIPLVIQLFDTRTLGVLFVHNVGAGLAFWTFGAMVLGGRFDRRWWRPMFNPPSVAIAVSLACNFLGAGAYLPDFVITSIEWLGRAAVPMSMILIGATIADELRSGDRGPGFADTAKIVGWSWLLRLGLLPLGFLAIAALVPGSAELKRVIIVEAAMPSAVLPILLARHHGGDPGTALRVALATCILSLVTMPLWIAAGLKLLGLAGGG